MDASKTPTAALRPMTLLLAIAAATAGLAPPARGQAPAKAAAPKVVPFRMLPSNHMVVQAKLNGKGPYRLVFDLGSPVTLLGNRAAEGSGAIDKKAPRSFLFGTRGEGKLKTLAVGELTAEDLPVIVLDHPALKVLGDGGKPLDGIIGYTFFARYRTTIDYKANEMTFTPVTFEVRDLMKVLPEQLTLGPKVAKTRVLAPAGLWGLTLQAGEAGDVAAPGVAVAEVRPGSPAAAAGLKPGDILTTLDGRWTATLTDAYAAAAGVPPGKAVDVILLRDGKELSLKVTPGDGI